jgi:hypothetical protein
MKPTHHPALHRIRLYFDAFHRGDSEAYAACWIYPACYWSAGAWSVVANAADMSRNNTAYERAQRDAGMTGGEVIQLDCQPLGADAALVQGRFTRTRRDGSLLAEIEAAYTVVRQDSDWKVAVCVVQAPC